MEMAHLRVLLLSWRVAFLVNVPLTLLALWATLRHVPETRDETAAGRQKNRRVEIVIVQ